MQDFVSMGGYAGYVWPSYAVTAVVLVAVLVTTWRGLKTRQRQLETLQAARGSRRARRGAKETAPPPSSPVEHARDA